MCSHVRGNVDLNRPVCGHVRDMSADISVGMRIDTHMDMCIGGRQINGARPSPPDILLSCACIGARVNVSTCGYIAVAPGVRMRMQMQMRMIM